MQGEGPGTAPVEARSHKLVVGRFKLAGGDEARIDSSSNKAVHFRGSAPCMGDGPFVFTSASGKSGGFPRLQRQIGMRRGIALPKTGGQFRAFPPCLSVEAPFSKDLAGFGRLERQIGRCLFLSRAEVPPSPFGSVGRCLPALPIAHTPIGKARPCGFGSRARNGAGPAAPESLPPKSVIGDGR